MSVRLPNESSSTVFEPKVVSSAPIRDSFSMPLISWQPKQPHFRTNDSPRLMFLASASCSSIPATGSDLLHNVIKYLVIDRASSSASRTLGMRVSGEKLRGFLPQWYTHCGPTLEAMSFKLGTRSFSLPTGVENSPSANPWQPLQPIVSTSFLPLATSLPSP